MNKKKNRKPIKTPVGYCPGVTFDMVVEEITSRMSKKCCKCGKKPKRIRVRWVHHSGYFERTSALCTTCAAKILAFPATKLRKTVREVDRELRRDKRKKAVKKAEKVTPPRCLHPSSFQKSFRRVRIGGKV